MAILASVIAHWRDPLYRNGYLLMLNSIVGAAFGFAFWLAVARTFRGDEGAVGYGAAVISAMTLVALVGKFGLDAALIRFVPRAAPEPRRRLVTLAVALAVGGSLAVGALFLATVPSVVADLRGLPGDPVAGGLFLLASGVISVGWVLDGYFIAERRAEFSLYRNIVFNVVKLALPFLAVFQASALGIPAAWTAGIVASLVVAGVLVSLSLRRDPAGTEAPPSTRAFVRYAGLNSAHNVADFLPGLVLPIVVLHVAGREANAFFYIAWSIAFVAFLASKSIAQSTFAEMSHDRARVGHHLRKAALQNVLVLAPFVVLALGLGRFVLALFGPAYAKNAYPLLALLALSAVFVAVNALYATFLKARRATAELVVLPVVTVTVTFAAGYPLLASHGLVGLGAGWLLANAGVAFYSAWRLLATAGRFETHDEPLHVQAEVVRDPAH